MAYGKRINPYKRFTGIFIPQALVPWIEISAGAKLTYGRLARYAGESGHCFPSVETLGQEIGVGERQASRYLLELQERELIARIRRGSTSNEYHFYDHPIFDGLDVRSDRTDMSDQTRQICPVEGSPSYMKRVSEESQLNINNREDAASGESPRLLTEEEWPQTTALVQGRFLSVDATFMWRFIHASIQAVVSSGGDPAELTDKNLAWMVEEVFKNPKIYSAGLLLRAVPAMVENLVKRHAKVMR